MAFRHAIGAVADHVAGVLNQNLVLSLAQLFHESWLHRRCLRMLLQVYLLTVDHETMALVTDLIARQADDSFDVIDAGVGGQAKNDYIATLGLTG